MDDDGWEPDEDFFVQLFDENDQELKGDDTKCRVTIIDDDKPGNIQFEERKKISVAASEHTARVVISRVKGSDGVVTVDYETKELGNEGDAVSGTDFNACKGTLVF